MKIPLSIIFNIGTLFISISALVATLIYNNNQNMKWDALNKPQINPINISLIAFEEMSTKDATSRNWGYEILQYPIFKEGVYTGNSRIYSELVFWDANKNIRIPGNRVMTTMDDVKEETNRLKLQNVTLKKHLVFVLTFRNNGQLSANNIEISLKLKDVQGEFNYQVNNIKELAGGESTDYKIDFFVDVNIVPVATEHFITSTRYEYAGKKYTKERKIAFDMFSNNWSFE